MENNFKILEDRLIRFSDILGFSELLKRESLEFAHAKYSRFIDNAKTMVFYATQGDNKGRTNFEYAEFLSDSIILVSNPINDVYNVNNFIGAVNYLMETGFVDKLPLRGAITKGDFLLDNERNIFLSNDFSKAVKFEGKQEWTGCIILEEAEGTIINSIFGEKAIETLKAKTQLRNNPVHYYPVPLKNNCENYFVLNFLFFLTKEQIVKGIDSLIQPKKRNLKKYFDFLVSLPIELKDLPSEFLPATYAKIMKTRSGMRTMFLDSESKPCQPGVEEFTYIAVGRWKD